MGELAPNEMPKVIIKTMEELQSLLWQQVASSMIKDLRPITEQSGIIETIDE